MHGVRADLEALLPLARRHTSRCLLQAELERVQRQEAKAPRAPPPSAAPPPPAALPTPLSVQKVAAQQPVFSSITRYAWDQSPKWVKVYVTLPGVENIADDAIRFACEPALLRLEVSGLPPPAGNSRLLVSPLYAEVLPDKSSCTRKPDSMLLLKLRKATEADWGSLDDSAHRKAKERELQLEQNKTKSTAELLQEMYRDADEEGKASLAQAWEQGRAKREARRQL